MESSTAEKVFFFQFPRSAVKRNQRDGGKEFTIAEELLKFRLIQVIVIWRNAFTGSSDRAVKVHSLGYFTVVFASCDTVRVDANANNFFI